MVVEEHHNLVTCLDLQLSSNLDRKVMPCHIFHLNLACLLIFCVLTRFFKFGQVKGNARHGRSTKVLEFTKLNLATLKVAIKLVREYLMQQSTPNDSDYLGFDKHGAKTYQEVLKMDHEYCRRIDQVEDRQCHWNSRFSHRG